MRSESGCMQNWTRRFVESLDGVCQWIGVLMEGTEVIGLADWLPLACAPLLQDDEITTSSQMVERLTLQVTELEDSMQDLAEQNQSLRSRNGLLAQEMEAVQEEVGGVYSPPTCTNRCSLSAFSSFNGQTPHPKWAWLTVYMFTCMGYLQAITCSLTKFMQVPQNLTCTYAVWSGRKETGVAVCGILNVFVKFPFPSPPPSPPPPPDEGSDAGAGRAGYVVRLQRPRD